MSSRAMSGTTYTGVTHKSDTTDSLSIIFAVVEVFFRIAEFLLVLFATLAIAGGTWVSVYMMDVVSLIMLILAGIMLGVRVIHASVHKYHQKTHSGSSDASSAARSASGSEGKGPGHVGYLKVKNALRNALFSAFIDISYVVWIFAMFHTLDKYKAEHGVSDDFLTVPEGNGQSPTLSQAVVVARFYAITAAIAISMGSKLAVGLSFLSMIIFPDVEVMVCAANHFKGSLDRKRDYGSLGSKMIQAMDRGYSSRSTDQDSSLKVIL